MNPKISQEGHLLSACPTPIQQTTIFFSRAQTILKLINPIPQKAGKTKKQINKTINFPSTSESNLQLNVTAVSRRSAPVNVHHTAMFLSYVHAYNVILFKTTKSCCTLREVSISLKVRITVYISQDCKAIENLKWLNRKTIHHASSLRLSFIFFPIYSL